MADDLLPNVSRVNRMMWLGLGIMGLGVIAIISPFLAGNSAVVVLGLILLAAGLGQLHSALQGESGTTRFSDLIKGAITTLSSVLVLAHPLFGLGFLTLLLVIYFVADGVWKVIEALQYMSAPGWLWLLASGVLSLLLGLLIWKQWPLSGTWAVGILIGVNLLATGGSLVAFARSLKGSLRNVWS